jgi:hypothetical protein
MVSEPFHLLDESVPRYLFQRLDNAGMEHPPPLLQETAIGVYKNFKRYFATATAWTTRHIPLVTIFSPTKHFACILYICAV